MGNKFCGITPIDKNEKLPLNSKYKPILPILNILKDKSSFNNNETSDNNYSRKI